MEIDDFRNSEEKIKNFSKNLLPKTNNEQEKENKKLIKIILYVIRFDKKKQKNKDICDKTEFENVIDQNLIEQLNNEIFKFIFDLQKFNNNCYEINYILSKYNYFLRVFELKKKIRQLSIKDPKKQK